MGRGSRVGCKAKHATRVGAQACCLCAQRVSNPLSLMQRRESLVGAQPGKSVFQWSQRVKINLEPAMTRTAASKIKTVRTGNLRLPKYEPIAAAERINANAGMDCLAPIAKNRKLDARSPFFVMSSEVEASLITARTESKRFLDFARNDKKVLHGIGSY